MDTCGLLVNTLHKRQCPLRRLKEFTYLEILSRILKKKKKKIFCKISKVNVEKIKRKKRTMTSTLT